MKTISKKESFITHCSKNSIEGGRNNFPEQHFEELLCQSKQDHPTLSKTKLPKPKNLSEYLIYYIHHFQRFFKQNRFRPSGYWRYAINVYKNLFLVFYFNWISIFTAPISALAFLIAYPILSGFLFAFEIGLKVALDYLGGAKLVENISKDYGNGYSIINWGKPYFFESKALCNFIRSTLPAFGKSNKDKEGKEKKDESRHKTFDISIAQTLTVLSSIVYERHDEKVKDAYNALSNKHRPADEIESIMKRLVHESEEPIRRIASNYGLSFAGVTELKSLGGPFCGLYWPTDNDVEPFIIVAFKGTTPTNYSEFLVDCTFQRTDARAYLFGSAHEGFYDSLFPTHVADDEDSRDPYYAIQSAVKQKALELQEGDSSKRVKVWVTGHSLGAAMGALLFARWLKCPEDIEPLCELADAYVIGTPAVGDNDFASLFASYSNTPLSRESTLWRIINKSDVICRIPLGYNNVTVGHYAASTDFFNYSHVGHAVQITYPILSPEPLKIYPSSYQSNLKVDVIVSTPSEPIQEFVQKKKSPVSYTHYPSWLRPILQRVQNPIPIVESFYPFFIKHHIPIHYFEGLDRARTHYENCHESLDLKRKL